MKKFIIALIVTLVLSFNFVPVVYALSVFNHAHSAHSAHCIH